MAIFDLMKTITDSMDRRENIYAVFMDMSRAFDYVNHGLLLHKLYHHVIRGVALNLFESYLKNRKQKTFIQSICRQSHFEKE
jgi:hypothetical protein